jgi:hypothetical protein
MRKRYSSTLTWEDATEEYAALVTSWWAGGYATAGSGN